ncbi:hypothetical protein GQ42DRAFT_162399 [Ramicandelaber brevisporus]|nr:hypothetical protein GQ42DRAFT_162399 [Ramicandelaber brevisporus]
MLGRLFGFVSPSRARASPSSLRQQQSRSDYHGVHTDFEDDDAVSTSSGSDSAANNSSGPLSTGTNANAAQLADRTFSQAVIGYLALVICIIVYCLQTILARYLQGAAQYQKPYMLLWLAHGGYFIMFPLHIGFLAVASLIKGRFRRSSRARQVPRRGFSVKRIWNKVMYCAALLMLQRGKTSVGGVGIMEALGAPDLSALAVRRTSLLSPTANGGEPTEENQQLRRSDLSEVDLDDNDESNRPLAPQSRNQPSSTTGNVVGNAVSDPLRIEIEATSRSPSTPHRSLSNSSSTSNSSSSNKSGKGKQSRLERALLANDHHNQRSPSITGAATMGIHSNEIPIIPKSLHKHLLMFLLVICTALSCLLNFATYLWYKASAMTTMAKVTALYNCACFFAYIFSIWLLKERIQTLKVAAVIISIAGVVLMMLINTGSSNDGKNNDKPSAAENTFAEGNDKHTELVGDIFSVVCSVLIGLYQVVYKRFILPHPQPELHGSPRTIPLAFVNLLTTLVGVATIFVCWIPLPILHWTGVETIELPTLSAARLIALNSVLGVAYNASYMIMVAVTSPVFASIGIMVTSPTMAILDVIITGKMMAWNQAVGAVLTLFAFGLLTYAQIRSAKQAAPGAFQQAHPH